VTSYEPRTPYNVSTPLGEARVIYVFDYGIDHNPVFLVVLISSGKFRCVDMMECLAGGNPMWNIPEPPYPAPREF
jgi:hypothetical protein